MIVIVWFTNNLQIEIKQKQEKNLKKQQPIYGSTFLWKRMDLLDRASVCYVH